LRTCEFPVGRADAQGNIIETKTGRAHCFDEDLGNGLRLTMIEVPEGEFLMGSLESESGRRADEGPQHKVHVRRFFIGQFEVTDQQWEALRKRPKAKWRMDEADTSLIGKQNPKIAVAGISWPWAVEFCARLAKLTGKPYRLPSEAEWEYAARAGTTTAYSFGPAMVDELAYCGRRTDGPLAIGTSGPANAFGLYDVHGNAEEWVSDSYHPNYQGAPLDGSPWLDKDDRRGLKIGKDRVIRGGSFSSRTEYCRSATRNKTDGYFVWSSFGMRVAMSASDE